MAVGVQDRIASGESAYQHQESRLGQVEVSEERIHDAEGVAGNDEEVDFAGLGGEAAARRLRDSVFEGTDGSGADGDNSAIFVEGSIDGGRGFGRYRVGLFVEMVILDALDAYGLEGAQSDVQGEAGDFDSALVEGVENF